jgi:hypothetical protein
MSWKSKMYILSNLLGQVNRLPTVEFLLQSKGVDCQPGLKLVQTGYTPQANAEVEATSGKEATAEEAYVQMVAKSRACANTGLFQLQETGLFSPLHMKSAALGNLAQMNLHD